ncbi:hypothetical protein [Ectobacillus polymachus]|uniref:hypothetical protein n=1 Tax=Ectobacillus polymachus TaxID=1508806 RepID=UPI003A8BCA7A
MASTFRFVGGSISILLGALLLIGHIINLGVGTILGETMILTSHLLMVFAFFVLYEAQSEENSILGMFGMLTGIIGTILVTAIVLVEIAGISGASIDAVFAANVPHAIHSFGPLLFVLGMILFGISVARGTTLPRDGGYLLIIGTVIFAVASLAGSAEDIFSVIGAIITGGGFIRLGLYLIKASPKEQN